MQRLHNQSQLTPTCIPLDKHLQPLLKPTPSFLSPTCHPTNELKLQGAEAPGFEGLFAHVRPPTTPCIKYDVGRGAQAREARQLSERQSSGGARDPSTGMSTIFGYQLSGRSLSMPIAPVPGMRKS